MPTANTAISHLPLAGQAAWLESYSPQLRLSEQGRVVSVGDGIAWISGLPNVAMDEVLEFEDGSQGMVFDLSEHYAGAILLHQTERLTSGAIASPTYRTLSIPVGQALLGRVVDPMGKPLDGLPEPEYLNRRPIDRLSPTIVERDYVRTPLFTGVKIIDTMIPIGKGQRQLIIGDSGLGRSALALDIIVSQKGRDVLCVYVLIRQKRSTGIGTVNTLREQGALDYTTVVIAEASALPGLQYLAPFTGCSIAEEWMRQGKDVLVVYDDLSNHAIAYRELSLLLRRPPGREAYPGDVFFLHARLLERATQLAAAQGGGSMTALPIVETQMGEIAAYIPTNLISITDGQIYLDQSLFSAGFRPAIDVASSVSRIGGKAQPARIKEEAGRMKLDYLQFLELERFTRFGARLEASMEARIRHGQVLRELLKQERFSPVYESLQLSWLVAFNEGLLDNWPLEHLPSVLPRIDAGLRQRQIGLGIPREQLLAWLRTQLAPPGAVSA